MADAKKNRPETMENGPEGPFYYVGIGASAGGLQALETFFSYMAVDSGMAFIVVQHLSPDYKSMMKELLEKRTQMPIHRAEEGMTVRPDAIYLIPPKKNLTIFHGRLMLSEQDHSRGLNLPIDVFLRSLAEDQGERAVGIILSGTGSDGMRGVRAIKESGGMVMVQTQESAKFDGMPRSAISTGLADFILPPEEMPGQLRSFIQHPAGKKRERTEALLTDEDGLNRIFSKIRERTGVDFAHYKPSTIGRRIERRMMVNGVHDLRDYVRFLESNPGEAKILYREFLIGVTSFFRDREAYDALRERHLPGLLARAEGGLVRLWTAGCSTGEEAYSLAILCQECLEENDIQAVVKIFATDVDKDAVIRAGNGVYPESIAADLSPRLLSKYFLRRNDSFQVGHAVREMVVFAHHNLIKDPPFTNIDLVSCRNLLIYLQPVLQKKALEFFNFSLNHGGLLFLGTSETTGEMADYFELLESKWKIFQSRGIRSPIQSGIDSMRPPDGGRAQGEDRVPGRVAAGRVSETDRLLERFVDAAETEYLPLSLVVNESMELVHVVGDTDRYFRLPSGRMQNDVAKMAVRDLAVPLATSIHRAFQKGETVRYDKIRVRDGERARIVRLRVKPLPTRRGQAPLVVVFVESADPESPAGPPEETAAYDAETETRRRIQDLEGELQFTRENLQATIEELETSNEELQATNEELLASNEELQSTNEELQSVNEELYTVNAEYQTKIMELTELTNDMDNLLNSTKIATLFLDENLEIRKFTDPMSDIYRIMEKDIGRPIDHLSHRLKRVDPVAIIRQVQESGRAVEMDVENDEGQWFLLRVLPYRVASDAFSGVVITFIDITKLQYAQEQLRSKERQLEAAGAASS